MNEKERIIELVRQNIITMDEALRLLEAGQATGSTPTSDTNTETKKTDDTDQTQAKDQQAKVDYGKQFSSIISEVVDQGLNVARNVTEYVSKVTHEAKEADVSQESEGSEPDYSQEYRQAQSDVESTVRENASEAVKAAERLQTLKEQRADIQARINDIQVEMDVPGLDEATYERLEQELETAELDLEAIELELDLLADEALSEEDRAAKLAEKSGAISAKIDVLTESLHKKEEALTIAKQRLREIEIFAELDELTEEMTEQENRLTAKVLELEATIASVQSELQEAKQEQESLYASQINRYKDQVKNFVDSASEKVTEAASQIGSDALKEGKSFGKLMGGQLKDMMNNFNMKEVNLSVNVPWVKTQKITHTFTYPASDLTMLDFKVSNGSLEFVGHDEENVVIDSEIRFHGSHADVSVERFMALSTISHTAEQLIFYVNHAKISMDAVVKLPKHLYNELKVVAVNGDLKFKRIDVKDLLVENKNGDIKLKHTKAQLLELDLLNGDVAIKESDIADISLKNLNGDFRITGNVGNIVSNTVNTDYFITKRDITPSKIKIKGVNGDVKISLPSQLNLEADCKVSFGDIHHRLSNVTDIVKSKAHTEMQRLLNSETEQVDIDVSLTTGDVFLKDSDK